MLVPVLAEGFYDGELLCLGYFLASFIAVGTELKVFRYPYLLGPDSAFITQIDGLDVTHWKRTSKSVQTKGRQLPNRKLFVLSSNFVPNVK